MSIYEAILTLRVIYTLRVTAHIIAIMRAAIHITFVNVAVYGDIIVLPCQPRYASHYARTVGLKTQWFAYSAIYTTVIAYRCHYCFPSIFKVFSHAATYYYAYETLYLLRCFRYYATITLMRYFSLLLLLLLTLRLPRFFTLYI